MNNHIASIHIREKRGKLVVQAEGRTPRGQRYLMESVELEASSETDPNFKTQMAAAVSKLDTP